MTTEVRKLRAIPLANDVKPAAVTEAPPRVELMNPADLSVDGAYQRELSDRSIKLINKLVREWNWRRFKPPVVARVGEAWHVIDGQHTAIAAISHGGIDKIPVLVIEADDTLDRAQAFIGHNRDRVAITNTQIFFAAATAGDEDALTVVQICERAGATILRNPSPGRAYRPGEVVAVAALVQLVRRRSAMKARAVVETLVKARAAPLSADLIRSVDYVLHDEQYEGDLAADDVASTILRMGPQLEAKAAELAMTKKMQRWRATAIVIFQNTRRRRGSARAA
jgi:hypothetical protein